MKSTVFLLIYILCLPLVAQQQAKVTYGVIFNTTKATEQLKAQYPDAYDRQVLKEQKADELNFELHLREKESVFFHPEVDNDDRILVYINQDTKGEHYYYTNLATDKRIESFDYWGTNVYIPEAINGAEWNVTNETKKIGSYTCFKATKEFTRFIDSRNRRFTVVAWFAPELPYQFGPLGYAGLPGLIVELEENHLTYYLKKIDHSPSNLEDIQPRLKGKEMSRQEFGEKSSVIKALAKQAIVNSKG